MLARGTTVDEVFTQFQTWYHQKLDEITPPATDYTPSMACTGRYWYRDSGRISFEVRILNNDLRPENHEVFRQEYRPDASHRWTAPTGSSRVPHELVHFRCLDPPLHQRIESAVPVAVPVVPLADRRCLLQLVEHHQLDRRKLCIDESRRRSRVHGMTH